MLSLLLVVLSLNLEAILGFKYVDTPMSWYDAKLYCKKEFGTDLATVVNPRTRRMALGAIKQRADAVWIGMEHESPGPDPYKCHFTYPDHKKYPDICPNYPYDWKCVDFWCHDKPKLIEHYGSECVTYNWQSRYRHGGVDNSIKCETKLPFLCKKPDEICDTENAVCLRIPFSRFCVCILEQFCDPNPFEGCFCDLDANGESRCVDHFVKCKGRKRCKMANGNAECPTGEACVATSCCARFGQAVCMPLCGEDAPKPRRLLLADKAETTEQFESEQCICTGAYYDECCPEIKDEADVE